MQLGLGGVRSWETRVCRVWNRGKPQHPGLDETPTKPPSLLGASAALPSPSHLTVRGAPPSPGRLCQPPVFQASAGRKPGQPAAQPRHRALQSSGYLLRAARGGPHPLRQSQCVPAGSLPCGDRVSACTPALSSVCAGLRWCPARVLLISAHPACVLSAWSPASTAPQLCPGLLPRRPRPLIWLPPPWFLPLRSYMWAECACCGRCGSTRPQPASERMLPPACTELCIVQSIWGRGSRARGPMQGQC